MQLWDLQEGVRHHKRPAASESIPVVISRVVRRHGMSKREALGTPGRIGGSISLQVIFRSVHVVGAGQVS